MNKVYACIDGFGNSSAVIDWAAWSAMRLDVPLEFLHVLERNSDRTAVSDHSGAIGLGAQESLLQELSELDEKRSKLAAESGRRLLAAARERARGAGVTHHDARLRHGELVDSVLDIEADARLFVLGEHRRGEAHGRIYLDHHVERVIRCVRRPVLVVTSNSFTAPTRFVIAFDGSPTARKTVETVARSPMLAGLPALLATAGSDTPEARRQLEDARRVLAGAGFHVETELAAGDPEDVLPALVAGHAPTLLVMGAYGHARIRQLIVGSTTTTLLRTSVAPVLILR